ncbi:MAG: ABC transporter permease [Thermoleophilia bacterium]|nr:ABC transporter permease [Thermoleophilia bacterium]
MSDRRDEPQHEPAASGGLDGPLVGSVLAATPGGPAGTSLTTIAEDSPTYAAARKRYARERRMKRLKFSWYLLRRNPLTITGLIIVLGLVLVALLAPLIAPHDPVKLDMLNSLQPPSSKHWLGTDEVGRDILSRIIHGAGISLRVGILAVLSITVLGVPIGLVAGTFGGWVDTLIMRVADIFLAFPQLVLALAIATALGGGMQNVIIALAIAGWPWYARLVRGLVLSVRQEAFIEAARVSGSSWRRVMLRHVMPNSMGPVIVQASMDMGYTILLAASLGFLGIGVKVPTPEWGLMINAGRPYFMDQWWVAGFPGIAILVSVLGFNMLGDGLRDLVDPRSRG